MLRDARRTAGLKQADAAAIAGLSQSTWSRLEGRADGRITMATWVRTAMAVGSDVEAYLRRTSAAGQPRDAVHLRNEELVIRTAANGGWRALPEQQIDRDARTSRAADIVLHRGGEYALVEVWDWFHDLGAAFRDWDRRLSALDRFAISRMTDDAVPATSGLWVVRATLRNRRLVADHPHLFRSRFAGSGTAWLRSLQTLSPMPPSAGLVWASLRGDRLFAARRRAGCDADQ